MTSPAPTPRVSLVIPLYNGAAVIGRALDSVRAHGTVTQVGLHVKPATIDPMHLSNLDLSLIGTWCYPVYDWPRITALIASGKYPVEKVLTEVIDVNDVVTGGFDRLLDPTGTAQKLLVRV